MANVCRLHSLLVFAEGGVEGRGREEDVRLPLT